MTTKTSIHSSRNRLVLKCLASFPEATPKGNLHGYWPVSRDPFAIAAQPTEEQQFATVTTFCSLRVNRASTSSTRRLAIGDKSHLASLTPIICRSQIVFVETRSGFGTVKRRIRRGAHREFMANLECSASTVPGELYCAGCGNAQRS